MYVRILLVAISRFLISCLVQLIISVVGVITGMAKVLWAVILLLLYRSELHIFLTHLLYSFVTLSLLRGPLLLIDSSWPRYVYIFSHCQSVYFYRFS